MAMVMQDQGEDDDLGRQERNVDHDQEAVEILEPRVYGVEQPYQINNRPPPDVACTEFLFSVCEMVGCHVA